MNKNFFRIGALSVLMVLTLMAGSAFAAGSPDLTIARIDASAVRCGGSCGGDVEVTVENKGRALSGGYNVFVELKVYEQGQGQRAKTYKEKGFNFPGESTEKFVFEDISVLRCNRPYVFEAKVYWVGGSLREGNTRNNELQETSYVRTKCSTKSSSSSSSRSSSSSSSSSSSASSSSSSSSSSRSASAPKSSSSSSSKSTGASPDLLIPTITPDVTCGSKCEGTVDVEVRNDGRALSGGYNVFVELKVYEQGQGQRAETYKESLFNFPGESSQTVTFDGVGIQRCGRPWVFEAKVYWVGGSLREGNTRNNDQQVTKTIYQSCS